MSAKHLENPVTLTLGIYDVTWLHRFLKDERLAAEIDRDEIASLHTDVAIRAAKEVLLHEHERMTKIIDALDEALAADDAREAIAKRIAATVPGMPDITNTHPPLSKEKEL